MDFLTGSVFFPLVGGPTSGSPPTLANGVQGYPPPANATGAWFGIETTNNGALLVLDLRDGSGKVARLPLALGSNGTITRPFIDPQDPQQWSNLAQFSSVPLTQSQQITITADQAQRRVRLLQETLTGPAGFGGLNAIELIVAQGQPVRYAAILPGITLELPPTDAPKLTGQLWTGC